MTIRRFMWSSSTCSYCDGIAGASTAMTRRATLRGAVSLQSDRHQRTNGDANQRHQKMFSMP